MGVQNEGSARAYSQKENKNAGSKWGFEMRGPRDRIPKRGKRKHL